MSKVFSVALHDLKISDRNAAGTIEDVRNYFGIPLTVHLVCDIPLAENRILLSYIKKKTASSDIEIVYHGVRHFCVRKVWRLLSWYHNYEAEYLVDSEDLRIETKTGYKDLSKNLGYKPGVCPPCWIALRKNIDFIDSLTPLYREELVHITDRKRRFFTSVISIGSQVKSEIVFLKMFDAVSLVMSLLFNIKRIRIAVHMRDLCIDDSMKLFKQYAEKLKSKGYRAVFLKDFINEM